MTLNAKKSALVERLVEVSREHADALASHPLRPGVDYLPPSGKVVGMEEFVNLLQASVDLWLTAGHFSDEFEEKFPAFWGLKHCLLVNSGSSANLVALAALTSPKLKGRALVAGDEFITPACGFPTTVAPALLYGLKPVFVDVDLETHNPTFDAIQEAISPKTKLIMAAHALGNPYRADLVGQLAKKNGLWFVEDCCDALGATIGTQHVGTYGHLATCSFYPAHHMTMGEGGAVLTSNTALNTIAMSFRDWGRDCWCPPGTENTCNKRFDWCLGDLPEGYDHKYIYSHIGYNLKSTDFQAAAGLAQFARLPDFIEKRRQNHRYLTKCLNELGVQEKCILPEATPGTDPSWFGYLITLRPTGKRRAVTSYLEKNKVGTRLLFAGNILKQPAFKNIEYRISGKGLANTDKLMDDAFWVGIWPGLGKAHLEYIAQKVADAIRDI